MTKSHKSQSGPCRVVSTFQPEPELLHNLIARRRLQLAHHQHVLSERQSWLVSHPDISKDTRRLQHNVTKAAHALQRALQIQQQGSDRATLRQGGAGKALQTPAS